VLLFFLACSASNIEMVSQKETFIVVRETVDFPLNEEFEFVFTLLDTARSPITPEDVVVDAEMPAHGHGMGQTPTTTNIDNLYTSTGMLFAMEGDWDIHIYVTEDGSVDQATYSVVCCE
tara:strand:- start:80 stop:436 length:357 start_codon:yes stop_codon:yes gene_type:complete